MNILIFKTVNEERTKQLLSSIDILNNTVYMVMPESEISIYSGLGLHIHCIGTKEKYIDYKTIMEEDRIPDIKFHEVWVLSPHLSNIYTYEEVYALISELKYCKVYYKAIGKDKIETYDLKNEIIFSHWNNFLVSVVKMYSVMSYWIEKKVKGCM